MLTVFTAAIIGLEMWQVKVAYVTNELNDSALGLPSFRL